MIRTYLLALLVMISLCSIALPRNVPGTTQTSVEYELIAIRIEVANMGDRQIEDLDRTDVTVYENGVKQTIFSFERVESIIKGGKHISYRLTYIFNGVPDGTRRRVRVAVRTDRTKELLVNSYPKSYVAPNQNRRP